jgi:hypothetical protein
VPPLSGPRRPGRSGAAEGFFGGAWDVPMYLNLSNFPPLRQDINISRMSYQARRSVAGFRPKKWVVRRVEIWHVLTHGPRRTPKRNDLVKNLGGVEPPIFPMLLRDLGRLAPTVRRILAEPNRRSRGTQREAPVSRRNWGEDRRLRSPPLRSSLAPPERGRNLEGRPPQAQRGAMYSAKWHAAGERNFTPTS